MDPRTELSRALTAELASRRSRNAAYSLRAFAAWLDLGPSSLSEIIAGKRKVSPRMAKKIASRLELPSEKTNRIVSALGKRSWLAKKSGQQYKELRSDQFALISSWVHFALLSLLRVKEPKITQGWIASKLGLSVSVVSDALSRLQRLGLVEKSGDNSLHRTSTPISSPDGVADLAIQKAHLENFELARDALAALSVEERDFTSITMAINPKKIPEAKLMIRAFRDRLAAVLEDDEASEVYRLSMQLFPLKGNLKQ